MFQLDGLQTLDVDQLRSAAFHNETLLRDVAAGLIEETSLTIGRLQMALRKCEWDVMVTEAHTAKNVCANAGAELATALLIDIEYKAKAGDLPGCNAPLAALVAELENLRQAVAAL